MGGAISSIGNAIGGAVQGVENAVSSVAQGVGNAVGGLEQGVAGLAGQVMDTVENGLQAFGPMAAQVGLGVLGGGLPGIAGALMGGFPDAGGFLGNLLGSAGNLGGFSDILQGGLGGVLGKVTDPGFNFAGPIGDIAKNFGGVNIGGLVGKLAPGLENALHTVGDAAGGAGGLISAFDKNANSMNDVMDKLSNLDPNSKTYQSDLFGLQQQMSHLSQLQEMLTSMAKQQNDMAMSMIRNMRG